MLKLNLPRLLVGRIRGVDKFFPLLHSLHSSQFWVSQPPVITHKFSKYSQNSDFPPRWPKGPLIVVFGEDFPAAPGACKSTSLHFPSGAWSASAFPNISRGVSAPAAPQSGFLKRDSGLSPSGSFTSVTPGAPWPSAWGRLAPWRKAASSPPSSSKSSSRRCCYRTSWLWAWGKKNRGLKTQFSVTLFSVFFWENSTCDPFISLHWSENVGQCSLLWESDHLWCHKGPILDFKKHPKVHKKPLGLRYAAAHWQNAPTCHFLHWIWNKRMNWN